MFYALAIVCDDYFVPSLEKISEVRSHNGWAPHEQLHIVMTAQFAHCPSFKMLAQHVTKIHLKVLLMRSIWKVHFPSDRSAFSPVGLFRPQIMLLLWGAAALKGA